MSRYYSPDDSFFSALVGRSNKSDIHVSASKSVLCSSYWSGGSRDEWHSHLFERRDDGIIIVGGMGRVVNLGSYFPMEPGLNEMVPGEALIKTGTFHGKTATPHVYLHPDDYAAICVPICKICDDCKKNRELAIACAASGNIVKPRQIAILKTFQMTGGYRKTEQAKLRTTPTDIGDLAVLGLLKKAGSGYSLTADGRNYADSL